MPLKFLRFPQLIQSEIMDNLLPEDIFLLSLCSQNSFKVLQSNFRKSTKLKITVNVSISIRVGYILNGRRGQFAEFLKYPFFCRSSEDVTIGGNRMVIHFDVRENDLEPKLSDDSSNVKLVMDHILKLFRNNVHYVKLHGESKERKLRSKFSAPNSNSQVSHTSPSTWSSIQPSYLSQTGNHFMFNQMSYTCPVFPKSEPPPQCPNSLRTDLNISEILSWDTVDHLDTNVSIPFALLKEIRKTVWLKEAQSVTLDDLMNMDQVEIYLENSNLTNLDINRFLTNWRWKGGNPRMRLLHCHLREQANFNEICRGIEWQTRSDKIRECSSIRREEGSSLNTPDGVRLKLIDYFEMRDWGIAGKCVGDKITLHFSHPKPDFKPRPVVRSQSVRSYIPFDYFS